MGDDVVHKRKEKGNYRKIVRNARATYVIKGDHEDFYKGVLQILKR